MCKQPKYVTLVLITSFLVFCNTSLLAQTYNNWLFGSGAGLSFNANISPSVPYNIPGGKIDTYEGTSAISDDDGNLLFYTDGITIYNKEHEVMVGGDGILGNKSAYQAAVIIKVPGNNKTYYVFTADAIENDFKNGYRYAIVNMDLDNGKGGVVSKNHMLSASGTERLTATRHANSVDSWVITNDKNSNTFRAWLITCNGLNTTPVVSNAGVALNNNMTMNMGSIKVSPNGKKLCQTHFNHDDLIGTYNFFQIFDFNNTTGVISNGIKVSLPENNAITGEFSPNSQLLYLTDPAAKYITQVEVLPNGNEILNSIIPIPANYGFYDIQIGPDKKIYTINFKNNLSVINNPNEKGVACNFNEDQILLQSTGRLSLPFTLNDLDPDPHFISFQSSNSCTGRISFFGNTSLTGNVQWEWDFGDGTISRDQNPVHIFNPANKVYQVKLKIISTSICGSILRTKYVSPTGIWTKANFNIEVKCDSNYVRFSNTSIASDSVKYLWSFGDGHTSTNKEPIHRYSTGGTYSVKLKIISTSACSDDSLTKSLDLNLVTVKASDDKEILEGQSIQLSATGTGIKYEWSPAIGLSKTNVSNPIASPTADITYVVTTTNDLGCTNSDSVYIKVNKLQDIFVPSAFTPNNDGLNDVIKPFISASFKLNSFRIYNRWGEIIFTTTEKGRGWNGNFKTIKQPTGTYVWVLQVMNAEGKYIQRKGTIVLIR